MFMNTKNNDTAYWRYQVLFWLGYSAISVSFAVHYEGWTRAIVVGYLLYPFYSIGLTHLLHREFQRWSRISLPTWQRVVRSILAILAVGAVQTFLIAATDLAMEGRSSMWYSPSDMLSVGFGTTSAVGMWVWIHQFRQQREQRTRLQLALREAELSALEAQINPHFLFNCLNSIRALVAENPARAQDMITRLANIFRYNLHREPAHTVPLSSEVEVVEDYLALESVRFEDRLRVKFAISPDAGQAMVPSMLLQALVENALKHGIAPRPSGGELLIRAEHRQDATMIEVENSGQLAEPAASESTTSEPGGVGLNNTRERLRILYGGRASLQLRNRDGGWVVATVLIPAQA